jgi:hypothetical protein
MGRKLWGLLVCLLLVVIAIGWVVWARPRNVDMASYAPADSLLYVEANRPLEVLDALAGTDASRAYQRLNGPASPTPRGGLLQNFIRLTGIGPVESVILARVQVAAVITDVGAAEEGEALRIKQEEAILLETHTSERRIRAPMERVIKDLAEKFYGRPTLKRVSLDGVEFLEWSAPDNARQIVGVIVGSLVIIGNTEQAVQNCLAATQGKRQSLQSDPELTRMRLQLGAATSLAFGYVPAASSPRLLALGLPILLGHAPADSQFQRLIAAGAGKVFGSLAWAARPYRTGIEDQYSITLQPAIVTRLKPGFIPGDQKSQLQAQAPEDAYSITSYRFTNPGATWQSFKGAVSSQVDALSTVVFSTLLNSALQPYGVDDPDAFLGAVGGEVLTIRLDENAERSIMVAEVREGARLRELIRKKLGASLKTSRVAGAEIFEDAQGELAAAFINELVVMGDPAGVRRYLDDKQRNPQASSEKLKQMASFASEGGRANIVTYTNDAPRVRRFFASASALRGVKLVNSPALDQAITDLPFAVTETSLGERGIERLTRSPLGQFSTLLPLVAPEQPAATPR